MGYAAAAKIHPNKGETMIRNKVLLCCVVSCVAFTAAAAEEVRLQSPVPYAEDNFIAANIKAECPLGQQLADFVREFSARSGVVVVLGDAVSSSMEGRVLKLEILDAQSTGNAWTGHLKSTSVRGALYENGVKGAAFSARRLSRGGFGAGFKGSCSVLGRTIKAIGSDIATWLARPVDGARLGDL
jgi:hypothetical protein